MTLQDFAAHETSTVIERLLARRADVMREQLRAVSDALAELERAAEAPVAIDSELELLAARLNDNAAGEVDRVRDEGRAALQSLREEHEAELERLKHAVAVAQEAHERLEADRRRTEREVAAKVETITTLQLELEDARRALDDAFADVVRLGTDLEGSAAEKGQLTIELATARGELQMALSQRDAIAAQLKASVGRARMRGPAQAETPEVPVQQEIATPAGNDLEKLTATIEAAVRSVEELTGASSTADLLNRLAQQLSTEFCRVALFRVQGNRLQGEHQVGFDYTTEVRKIAMPLSVDSLLTRVVATGRVERLSREDLADESKGAPFRGDPTLAVALPVLLRGETIAVAYVDNWNQQTSAPGRGSDESSVLFARLVIRQSGVLFIGLAHEMRVLTELREYAAMLLKGAEQMYSADVDARLTTDLLRSRLEDNLACARQLFAQRAALEGPAAAGLLDEQIEATVEADPSSAFVRELAAVRIREHEMQARRSEAS